ncbi:MAG: FkbM family methyltransferase [Flavobacteriia bacterium]|nr:FkbM family methyltransferase [Flavobacteriia bacterium]
MKKSTKLHFCELLAKNNFPLSNIIDVGVQYETVELRENFKHVHQVLIEPQPHLLPIIRENYQGNDFTLLDVGVSDVTTTHFVHSSDTNLSVLDNTPSDTEVQVDTLDNICKDLEKWLLLKIDVDGPECKVLNGAKKTLEKSAFVIIEAQLSRFKDISDILHGANFDLFGIIDPLYLDDCLWQVDLVFINKDVKNQYPEYDIEKLHRSGNTNFN